MVAGVLGNVFQGSITLAGVSGLGYTNNTPPGNVNIVVPGRHQVDGRWHSCSEEDIDSLKQPPGRRNAVVSDTVLRLPFHLPLDPNSRPANNAFTVTVGGNPNAVTNVAISGRTVTLTLTTAVQPTQTVTMGYTKPTGPSTNPLAGLLFGTPVETFTGQTVTNNSFARAVGNTRGTTSVRGLYLNRDHAQAFTTGSATDGYQLEFLTLRMRDEGTTPPVYTMSIWSNTVEGGMDRPGTLLDTLTLTNPTTLPGSYGWVRFEASTPIDLEPNTKYWVMVDVTSAFSTDASIHGNLNVGADSDAAAGWSMNELLYKPQTDTAWKDDITANYRMSIFARPKTAPVFQSASVTGIEVSVTFSDPLDGDPVTGAGGFTVKVDGTSTTINGYIISGNTVTITLGSVSAMPGHRFTVSYIRPSSNPLQHAGGLVSNFTDRPVTNNAQ